MSESRDMDAPVTRREMYDALETWAGAIVAKIAKLTDVITERTDELRRELAAVEVRLGRELRQHVKGNEEELATRLVAVDEHYKDLPARVTRLEAKVFAPRKRSVATARRRKRS